MHIIFLLLFQVSSVTGLGNACPESNMVYKGNDLPSQQISNVVSWVACSILCRKSSQCRAWSYIRRKCFLKDGKYLSGRMHLANGISASRTCIGKNGKKKAGKKKGGKRNSSITWIIIVSVLAVLFVATCIGLIGSHCLRMRAANASMSEMGRRVDEARGSDGIPSTCGPAYVIHQNSNGHQMGGSNIHSAPPRYDSLYPGTYERAKDTPPPPYTRDA